MNRHSLYKALASGMLAASPLVVPLVGAAALLVSAPAEATTFANLTVEQMTDTSSMIVRGTVVEVWSDADEYDRIWTHARVQVSTVYKGADVPETIVVDQLGGTYRGSTLDVPGRAWFSVDEDALLFLNRHESGRIGIVEKYLGKYLIRRAPGETRLTAQHWSQPATEAIPYDGRFLPHAAPEDRVYLDDVLARVQARVTAGWDGGEIPGVPLETLRTINLPENRLPR